MKDEFISKTGLWGQYHYNYLKKYSPKSINTMCLKGTLEQYITDFDRGTQEMYDRIIRQYVEIEALPSNSKPLTASNKTGI